jgi:hypothetical protein
LMMQTPIISTKYIKHLNELEKVAWSKILFDWSKNEWPERFEYETKEDYLDLCKKVNKENEGIVNHIYKIELNDDRYNLDCIEFSIFMSIVSKTINMKSETIYIFLKGDDFKTIIFENKQKINSINVSIIDESIEMYKKLENAEYIKLLCNIEKDTGFYKFQHLHACQIQILIK